MRFLIKALVIVILVAVDSFIFFKAFENVFQKSEEAILPKIEIANIDSSILGQEEIVTEKNKSELNLAVEKALVGTKGSYAVVVKNLKTEESYSQNEEAIFEPASLYKLWVMAAVYNEIKKGELDKDQVLSQNVVTLNRKFGISKENAELTSGVVTKSVEEAIDQMITISHNYAAMLLSEKIGNSTVKKYLRDNGFVTSDLGDPPKTSAKEIALYFEKLYQGKLIDIESSEEMLKILKDQKLKDGLPKLLPKDTVVAHKTGDLGYFKHDAGIVFTEKGDYIIVVLSESESPKGAQIRIAEVSKAVFEYFNQ